MSEQLHEVQITLNTIEALFAEPEADPFDPESRYLSGIDEIAGVLRLMPRELDEPTRLTIQLPETAVTPTTQSILSAALNRYCAAKIAENQQTITEIRLGSRRETISAIAIIAALAVITILLLFIIPQLQQISGVIVGFVGIAIWVVLWDPIYNYVYAWRPNYIDIRVYENIRNAELVIESTQKVIPSK